MNGRPGVVPRVTLDMQAAQSATYKERGVARYALDYVDSACRAPRHRARAGARPPRLGTAGTDREPRRGRSGDEPSRWETERWDLSCSLAVRPGRAAALVWPRAAFARGWRFVVTVYDLIPDQFPDIYLQDPGTRRRYQARLEIVRAADHVMTLSAAVAEDVYGRLGVPRHRISVVGAACATDFSPTKDRSLAEAQVRALVPGIAPNRDAHDRLQRRGRTAEEHGAAAPRVRPRSQRRYGPEPNSCWSVGWSPSSAGTSNTWPNVHGVSGQVLLTGEITDEAMVALYRTAELVVFPSFAEGYGLPVAEAMACGAPVVASTNPALVELVAPGATFDPYSEDAIAAAVTRPLVDPDFRAQLVEWSARPRTTWADVAERAVEVYARVAVDSSVGSPGGVDPGRRRRTVAVVTPWPPAASGVALYSARLVEEMSQHVDVEVFVEGDERARYVQRATGES